MNIQKEERKKICISITKSEYDLLTQLAREDSRTVPGYIRWLLRQHLRNLRP